MQPCPDDRQAGASTRSSPCRRWETCGLRLRCENSARAPSLWRRSTGKRCPRARSCSRLPANREGSQSCCKFIAAPLTVPLLHARADQSPKQWMRPGAYIVSKRLFFGPPAAVICLCKEENTPQVASLPLMHSSHSKVWSVNSSHRSSATRRPGTAMAETASGR